MKRQFRLSDDELAAILKASQPVTYMVIGGHAPTSPQENANRAWKEVAAAHGFVWDSVEGAGTGDNHDIYAEPIPPSEPLSDAIAKERGEVKKEVEP